MSEQAEFAVWAIVEVYGHTTYAGRVTEQRIAGAGFIRIDIPEVNGRGGGAPKFFGPRSIFMIHGSTEENVRAYIARAPERAIDVFARVGQEPARALTEGDIEDWDRDEGEDGDDHSDRDSGPDDEDLPF